MKTLTCGEYKEFMDGNTITVLFIIIGSFGTLGFLRWAERN